MSAQIGATVAAVETVVQGIFEKRFWTLVWGAFAAITLGGCAAPMAAPVGADPADPTVPVAAASYRSTIAPYDSLRPAAPARWREQNERVTPRSSTKHRHGH